MTICGGGLISFVGSFVYAGRETETCASERFGEADLGIGAPWESDVRVRGYVSYLSDILCFCKTVSSVSDDALEPFP